MNSIKAEQRTTDYSLPSAHLLKCNVRRRAGKKNKMSNKVVTILKCNNCQDGKVKLIVKGIKDGYEVEVKKCDSCGKYFGVKSVSTLEKLEA